MSFILPFGDKHPAIAPDAFVAPNATVIGDTEIGARRIYASDGFAQVVVIRQCFVNQLL